MKSFCPPPSPPDFGNITTVTLLILLQPGGEGGGQEQAKNDHFNWRHFFRGSGKPLYFKKRNQNKNPQRRKDQDNSNGERISRVHYREDFQKWNPARGNFGGTMSKIRLRSLDYFLNL